jgi:anti-sigma regulatory factor (Ser/Thr protein kinase)
VAVQRQSQRSLELRLQARPEVVPVLRDHIRAWLEDAGASNREIFDILIATTEAFANAVEHPHEPTSHLVDVEGSFTDGCVTISIHDYGTWQSDAARKEDGGLGLAMIEALMDAVQVECDADGTTVTMRGRLAPTD